MSVQKAQTTATSTPSARTQPNPTTASASLDTREMEHSARVSATFPSVHPSESTISTGWDLHRNAPVVIEYEGKAHLHVTSL